MSRIRYSTETLAPRFSETVIAELDSRFSRRKVQLAPASGPLPFGLVLMKNANGAYAPLTETAASGEGETAIPPKLDGEACAVLIEPVDASEIVQQGLVLAGYAIVNTANLCWDKSVTQKSAALDQLEKRGFILENIAEADDGDSE